MATLSARRVPCGSRHTTRGCGRYLPVPAGYQLGMSPLQDATSDGCMCRVTSAHWTNANRGTQCAASKREYSLRTLMDSRDEANGDSGRGQLFASTAAAGCGCLGSSPSLSIAGCLRLWPANKTSTGHLLGAFATRLPQRCDDLSSSGDLLVNDNDQEQRVACVRDAMTSWRLENAVEYHRTNFSRVLTCRITRWTLGVVAGYLPPVAFPLSTSAVRSCHTWQAYIPRFTSRESSPSYRDSRLDPYNLRCRSRRTTHERSVGLHAASLSTSAAWWLREDLRPPRWK
ncbi:hypothetical protein V8C26DRAFT_139559 [Trichoderma gracile]